MTTGDFLIGRIMGIPFRLHWSWFLAVFLIAWSLAKGFFPETLPEYRDEPALYFSLGVAAALGMFLSILLHELGHAIAARRYGISVRGIRLFVFGGVAELGSDPKKPSQDIIIAIAGPAVTFVLIFLFALGQRAVIAAGGASWTPEGSLQSDSALTACAATLLFYLAKINFMLLVFNLIPAFPLDGGRVLRGIVWAISGNYLSGTRAAGAVGIGFSYLMFLGGIYLTIGQGDLMSGLWLFFLGMFLQNAARSSIAYAQLQQMLRGASVSEVMTRRLITIDADRPVTDAIDEYFLHYPHKAYPVVADGKFVGILTLRALQEAGREHWNNLRVGEVVARGEPLPALHPRDMLLSAMRQFAESGASRLPVVQDGELVGLICYRDLMNFTHVRAGLSQEEDEPT